MKNLIVYAGNYSDINGKAYGQDVLGCNYPVSFVFNAQVTFTQYSTVITTSGDFTMLLGCDIQNSNVPQYKWLIDTGGAGVILEISHIQDANTAILKTPCAYPDNTFEFAVADIFGQPRVKQTYATDASAGFGDSVVVYTKNGQALIEATSDLIPLGAEPVMVNFSTDWAQYALNIQYA